MNETNDSRVGVFPFDVSQQDCPLGGWRDAKQTMLAAALYDGADYRSVDGEVWSVQTLVSSQSAAERPISGDVLAAVRQYAYDRVPVRLAQPLGPMGVRS